MSSLTEKLQAKSQEFKTNIDAAKAAKKEQVEQKWNEAKARAEKSKEEMNEKAAEGKSKFQQKLDGIKEKIQTKKAEVKGHIDAKKVEINANISEWDAQDAEDYAAATLDVALSYINEAESAAIEAVYARQKAEMLKA